MVTPVNVKVQGVISDGHAGAAGIGQLLRTRDA